MYLSVPEGIHGPGLMEYADEGFSVAPEDPLHVPMEIQCKMFIFD